MLVIDELHNVLAGRGESRREFLNLVRFLGNQQRIPLVGAGTREAYHPATVIGSRSCSCRPRRLRYFYFTGLAPWARGA